MKLILSLSLIFIISFTFKAQILESPNPETLLTINYVTEEEYNDLKSSGQLIGNEVLLSDGMVNPEDYKGQVYISHFSPEKATGCSGYFPPPGPSLPSTSIDDGWASASPFNLPFTFCFYGQSFNQVWMNNNGNISFNNGISSFTSSAFPSIGNTMIAAFWADFYLTTGGTMHATITPTAAIFNWVNMGYYSNQNDKINTCQIVITNGADPLVLEGNAAIHFADMQWTTGSASMGVAGFGGEPATVGANSGNGTDFLQIGRFDHAGVDYDGPTGLNDGVSWLDNKSFFFDFCAVGNIAPLALQTSYCDTLQVCSQGGTLQVVFPFTSPENTQQTHVSVSSPTLLNFTTQDSIVSSTGSITVNIFGGLETLGVHELIVTAIDNYITPDTTTITYYVEIVDGTGFFTPAPEIQYTPGCSPVSFTSTGTWDSYLWQESGGGTSPTNTNSTYVIDGQFNGLLSLTVTSNGCSYTFDSLVTVNPVPPFNFAGSFDYCSNEFFTNLALSDSAVLSSVNWYSNGAPTISIGSNYSINLVGGQYIVEIEDGTGTCSNDTVITISMIPSPQIFVDTFACDLNFQVFGTFSNSGGSWATIPGLTFSNPFADNPLITAAAPGIYTVTYTDNTCGETLQSDINFIPYPSPFPDTTICINTLSPVGQFAYNNEVTWSSSGPGLVNFSPDNATFLPTLTFPTTGTYTITMTDKKCLNPVTSQVIVAPMPSTISDTLTCNGTVQLTGTTAYATGVWTASSSDITFSNATILNPVVNSINSGVYLLYFTDNTCSDTDTVEVTFNPDPIVSLSDTNVCDGTIFTLSASGSNVDTYTWNTGDVGQNLLVSNFGMYIVEAENICGTVTDSLLVSWFTCDVTIPNIIVLSSTQGNNVLTVDLGGVVEYNFVITNRWGNVVFETNNPSAIWNGTQDGNILDEGVYFYMLSAKISNGTDLLKNGSITLYH